MDTIVPSVESKLQKELRDNLLVNLRSVNSEEIIFYSIHVK